MVTKRKAFTRMALHYDLDENLSLDFSVVDGLKYSFSKLHKMKINKSRIGLSQTQIIHQEKTKKVTTVTVLFLITIKFCQTLALSFSKNY